MDLEGNNFFDDISSFLFRLFNSIWMLLFNEPLPE